ncbi:BadF/BadG/BcrA/BcrD ATPase family protein [Pseudogemmobacter faecipullorum]|uniref:ATPase n=1 Tax=Pseudogemmobacter faecipullorum TaxID=2755041 RepID=A0ABS8CL18_9RHOB|nr:BadF/BadG/BcrA/BcrD ATPase family protein [Pseudogemmobacter faecipullorum]MCB5409550.1 ATPase [Pseudogemmobacter faecipullorum]
MSFILGIDGGGTGCRAVLADASGRVIGQGQGGAANIRSDLQGSLAHILAATAEAARGHDIPHDQIRATLGLAGANVSAVAEAFLALLPFGRAQIVSDGLTATRGALGRSDGILAALGTGSVFSVQYQGQIRQVGGRGFMLGDEGSGAQLGRALLADVLRADDGLLPMTPLLAGVLAEFGGGEEIIAWSFRATPGEYAALAPRIAASEDPAARAIMARAAAQLREIILGLQPGGALLPVSYIGGLGPAYAQLLREDWPEAKAQGTGLDGALQLALEMAPLPGAAGAGSAVR